MKTVVIIQARMGSTRLPGKVMKKLFGKTILQHVTDRISSIGDINEIVIATTESSLDDIIVDEAKAIGINVFRGSENDVLDRYYRAALTCKAETIIRITSDCPLIDSNIVSSMISQFNNKDYDYVSNTINRTFPRGLDAEIFSIQALEEAFLNASSPSFREHVTPYIYNNKTEFKIYDYLNDIDYSKYRWTLDTVEDWKLIESIYCYLYESKQIYDWKNIISLMECKPELHKINCHIEQKKVMN
ncbi:spore coat polysaccharide biosynthesis protein SpsF [Paenibacillus sp. ov031]|uniref:cytidylyltransferase domain-containing protein n=1 Tax=Paenibacillus sp. ov031 TaxID=1761879 RepID=UPI00092122C1|nr:glycosyltransferase family protein [Paenibacillus sp. ov031]SHN67083.1 spore coat polysaccharide biosynthesis protein SpsF [Paenibacillus sp. ov031]